MSDSLKRRLERLKDAHRDAQHEAAHGREHERERSTEPELRAELRRDAEHANDISTRDGFGPLFEITEDGAVVSESDGRPVVRQSQISGELFYRLHIYEREQEASWTD